MNNKHYFSLNALVEPMTTLEAVKHAALQSLLNHGPSTANDRARMENADRGGCWHDVFIRGVGSRSWTLEREKNTPQTLNRTQRYCEEALAWLVNDGWVKAVRVDVMVLHKNGLLRKIIIVNHDDVEFEVEV